MLIEIPPKPGVAPPRVSTASEFGNSRYSDAERCWRLFQLRHVKHLVSPELSYHLDRGIAFHAGAACYYLGGTLEEINDTIEKSGQTVEGRESAREMMSRYIARYEKERKKVKVLGAEVFHSAKVDLGNGVEMEMTTRYDLIASFPDVGICWPDHKTVSQIRASRMVQYDWDGQLLQGLQELFFRTTKNELTKS